MAKQLKTMSGYDCRNTWVFSFWRNDVSDEADCQRQKNAVITLLLGEEASPSIGNTLWRISTMFTRWAIAPQKVNGFGWNLGNSLVYCLELALTDFGCDPHRSESRRPCGSFICQVNNTRLCRFPVSQISQNLHTRRGSMRWWILSE